MTDDRYDRITWRGFRFDKFTQYGILETEKDLGFALSIAQGSYNRGGVSASAGTHDGGGAVDFGIRGYSSDKIGKVVRALRSNGFAAWHRTAIPGLWGPHIHAIQIGNTAASSGAKAQVSAYKNHRNGLANNAADNTWHPSPIVNATYKVAGPAFALRIATMNLPAEDKLPNGAARIKRASYILRLAKPDIIGWNELQPIQKAGIASDFAHDVDAALGKNWYLVKPTKAWNENYISYRGDRLELVKQYDDSILEAPTGGRHITRAVFKHKASGQVLAVGQTHLVNGSTAAHDRDRKAQAADAVTSMKAVSAKHGNCPIIIQGDLNSPLLLPAFSTWKRTRDKADTSSTRNATTYTNYTKTRPSTNTDWVIDQQEVTPNLYVVGYTVIRDLDDAGNFKQPRPSDHSAVISSLKLA